MVAQLFVKTLTGKTTVLNVDPNATVESVKQTLFEAYGIPSAEQRLIVGSKQLEDGKTLADYNITSNTSVDVMLRLLGGVALGVTACTVTYTTITMTISLGTGGQNDSYRITISDTTNSQTYTLTTSAGSGTGWPVADGQPATFNWSSFTGTPSAGDSFTVQVSDLTSGQNGPTFGTAQTMPAACFLPTSRLLTPEGYKCAKDIRTGDRLVTSDSRSVPVQRYVYKVAKANKEAAPFLIKKNSIRIGYPEEDLRLSPNHHVEVKRGLWLMAKYFANLDPINCSQYGIGEPVTYYHFEAPNYLKDNFICEGVVVESYSAKQLDDIETPIFTYLEKEMANKRITEKPSKRVVLM